MSDSPAFAAQGHAAQPQRNHVVALLLLTLMGGALRFTLLDRPTVWGDEANTYSRVAGSYDTLLELLEDAGFAPLHYQLQWAIGRVARLTPTMLRLAPAIAGTLMIPAMYFLARQLVSRRAALITAAFTACSAWMLAYSRDAKMYMEFWLAVALHMGGLLWWMRSGRRVAWWTWVCAGAAMMGLNALGAALLAIEPVILLSSRGLRWPRGLAFVVGLLVIAAGPVGYYAGFSRFLERVDHGWRQAGIGWVSMRNAGQDGTDLIKDTASAYLLAWNWIQEEPKGEIGRTVARAAEIAFYTFIALLALGTLPWRTWRRGKEPEQSPQSWWRACFWLGIWLALPVAWFYRASLEDAVWPLAWLTDPKLLCAIALFILAGTLAWIVGDGKLRQMGRRGLQPIGVMAAVFALSCITYACTPPSEGSIWMPRYLGMLWPAMAVAVGALLARLPTRPLRWLAVAAVLGVNLVQGVARLAAQSEPPIDLVAADVWASQGEHARVRAYTPNPVHGFGAPGTATATSNVGLYYLYLLRGGSDPPEHANRVFLANIFETWKFEDARAIASDVRRTPELERIIVWENTQEPVSEGLLKLLGPRWHLANQQVFHVRVFWNWAWLYDYRRVEYVKIAAPSA